MSQGKTRMKVCAGVRSRRMARTIPPTTLAEARVPNTGRGTLMWRRKAPPLNSRPVQSATVLVAFAGTGGRPTNSRAGKAMKLPPPATALSAPASTAAPKSSAAFGSVSSGIGKQSFGLPDVEPLCGISGYLACLEEGELLPPLGFRTGDAKLSRHGKSTVPDRGYQTLVSAADEWRIRCQGKGHDRWTRRQRRESVFASLFSKA